MKPTPFCFFCDQPIEEVEDKRFEDKVTLLNGQPAHATCMYKLLREPVKGGSSDDV